MRMRSTDTDEMSGKDPTTLKGAQAAREELRARCLALVRRWQPLAQNGWDHAAARKLGEEVDQIAETSERLNLDDVNLSALELAAYLCSFVDDHLVPSPRNLAKLADMVNRLGAVLTDLSDTATAQVHTLPARTPIQPPPIQEVAGNVTDTTRDGDVMASTPATALPLQPAEPFDSFFYENSEIVLESTPADEVPIEMATEPSIELLPEPPNALAEEPVQTAAVESAQTIESAFTEPDISEPALVVPEPVTSMMRAFVPPAPTPINPALLEQRIRPTRLPRAVCIVGLGASAVPGLRASLVERGYDVREFAEGEQLLDFMKHAVPGALLVDARKLRVMSRINVLFNGEDFADERMPALIGISPDGDLGHRLLAMRAGASALFGAPVDSMRVVGKVDELLAQGTQPEWRVLLVNQHRETAADAARCLVERGMTARLANNGQSALTAMSEFRPDVIVVDCDLPDVSGIELTQLIRQQPEHAAVPIVLAADAADFGQRFDAIAAGGDEFLLKPVKARHLISAVHARAQRAHWLREMIGTPGGRDSRTGLFSRTTLIEKLEASLGDRSAALIYFAIDRSAILREQIGLAGLAAIDAHIGKILRAQLDELDVPAQFQDFSYFALVHRRSRNDVTAAAERVREIINQQPWQFNGTSHTLSASVGMGLLGGDNATVDSVVINAQAAQLAAAHLGGNRVLWFEAKEAALLPVDPILAVRAVLSRPLSQEHTRFEFQPIVPLAGKLTGQYELGFKVKSAQHPGTTIDYSDIAPAAADSNQIATVDRWLLQHALEVRQEQLKRGRQLRLFVPQAVTSAMQAEFLWWLERELKERRLSGTGITLELACSQLIDAGARGTEQLKTLHQLGVRFCLVDFGRDWAAVHALKNFHVDFVRLSAGLVAELGTAKSISDTLLALVRKAHAVSTSVIAPEIDNMQRAHLLLRLGVDYGCGPAFGRPQPQPDFDFTRPLF
jgi:EAL domain-containing protein (putative c-di-GMP-specific phosphodiesterase class I)/PleD family two-component response regulator